MRCPNVRKLQPRGRGHVVWKHAKNYACASFVLAIEGVGAPSFLRRYAADTVRGWFFLFLVSYRIVPRENFNLCRKEKKKKKESHYPNVSLSECSLNVPRPKYGYKLHKIWEREESSARILVSIWGWDVIMEISIVLRVFQRIVKYRKLETRRIIRFRNN